jgi:integrase
MNGLAGHLRTERDTFRHRLTPFGYKMYPKMYPKLMRINIGKKYQRDGIYHNVITESKKGKKKSYRAVFALWDGKHWHITQRTAGLVTQKDGKDWIDERIREHEQKGTKLMLAGKIGFATFVESYRAYLRMKGLKTYEQECQKLETMIDFFGNDPLEDIDYLRVMDFKAWMLAKPYTRQRRTGKTIETVEHERKDASAHRYLSRLRHLLKFAAKAGKVRAVPAFDDAIVVGNENPKDVSMSHQDFMRLLEACEVVPKGATENRRKWRLVLIAAYTLGCRVGELWDIRRGDITSLDAKNRSGVITIRKNKTIRGKTKTTTKKVAITRWLYDEMEIVQAFDKPEDERLFMWTKEYRGPVVNDKYSLYKLAGIDPEATFHTLRAANATNRDAAGQDFDALQDELGHAKGSAITRKHYIRPDDRQVIDASSVYNEYLERLRSESILDAEMVDR